MVLLLNIPAMQSYIGSETATVLSHKLGTKVVVERVDIGLFNRIIVDGIYIEDQKHQPMMTASRISAKISIISLIKGEIEITSAQLFGTNAQLYRETAKSKPNFQFVLDSLASKDKNKEASSLDIKINSLIIRHGHIKWDELYMPQKATFDIHHINADNISAHIILNALTNDSINLNIKKLAFNERTGLDFKSLTFKAIADKHHALLKDFVLELPVTRIALGDISASYDFEHDELQIPSLQYEGSIEYSVISPTDFSCVMPALHNFKNQIYLSSSFKGTSNSLRIKDINIAGRSINLKANGSINNWESTPGWFANIEALKLRGDGIQFISKNMGREIQIPEQVIRMGNIKFIGNIGGYGKDVTTKGILHTDAGNANIALGLHGYNFSGRIETGGINLGKILDNAKLGTVATHINADGFIKGSKIKIKAKGNINRIDYNNYSYRNVIVDGIFNKNGKNMAFNGKLNINDPNAMIGINGEAFIAGNNKTANMTAAIRHFNPNALHLINNWQQRSFNADIKADFSGNAFANTKGKIDITNFSMTGNGDSYFLDALHIHSGLENGHQYLSLNSDFANADIIGRYDYSSLAQSFINIVNSKLPTIPGLPNVKATHNNNFSLKANIKKSDWMNKLFNIPIDIKQPITLNAYINDRKHQIDVTADIPQLGYDNNYFEDGFVHISSPNDSLKADIHAKKLDRNGHGLYVNIQAAAANNLLSTVLTWNNMNPQKLFHGSINTDTEFFRAENGASSAHINFHTSDILLGDSIWQVQPSDIIYRKNHILIDHFAINHKDQHIFIAGLATKNQSDSILVDLKDVDVSYIMNLINFHPVEFSGKASGKAYIAGAFSKPEAAAQLEIKDFLFESGRLGTLYANAGWNTREGQIDINAIARDTVTNYVNNDIMPINTYIKGYVSPKKNYIDLGIQADGTRAEFLKSFCGSFMSDINAFTNGKVNVIGPLDHIELVGDLLVNGNLHISTLNTDYHFNNLRVHAVPDEIYLQNDSIKDKDGNLGIINGAIHHKHLTDLSYDLGIKAYNLLTYDTNGFGDNTFYGTAYMTGDCNISGQSGEVNIDVNGTPGKGSVFVYNVESPNAINNQEFIHWSDRDSILCKKEQSDKQEDRKEPTLADIPSDIKINFLINMTPDATLKLIMDKSTGDYITLNGNGGLRATYYNKGSFDMYGNYLIDHGIYKLTIQNVIKKDFQFQQGGTISFGGDPYNATINLKALYTVQGVSLADLSIGNSFSRNNIKVNCLMNITGTPSSPKVDFSLDMPTVNNDAKQMILSIINSQEEMNQQVLYLLAIGRFYTPNSNNASENGTSQQSQTSLAMQSILSGTVSQQINNVLSSVINNTNWNFGANISTGDEGFNNAEYEGLLSGRLLNNRLLINGQFGYRDNAYATTSFIGDFDIRYLIFPNGNFAIRVYNQTNDRYFTRNSLNTQGMGFILKKDFNGFRDLFGIGKHSKRNIKH